MPCFAPSEIIDPETSLALQTFGYLAESFISQEYLEYFNRGTKRFFPASKLDMEDVTIKDWFENKELHVAFLAYHNETKFRPKGGSDEPKEPVDANKFRVPDLLTHEPEKSKAPTRAEYYEIKANSRSGVGKGRKKLKDLQKSYKQLELPYKKGDTWKPDEKILMFDGPVLGIWLIAHFHYFHLEDGLIVYDVCVESDWLKTLALAMLIMVLAALIVWIINRGRIPQFPKPAPQLPPSPVPNPISPTPVPVFAPGRLSAFDGSGRRSMPVLATLFPQSGLFSSKKLLISDSVGTGGRNNAADVKAVQHLLNDWLGANRKERLRVDGIAGPRTNGAIMAFQNTFMPVRDGRVDPDGFTIGGLVDHHIWSIFNAAKPNAFLSYGPPVNAHTALPPAMIDLLLDRYLSRLREG